MLGRHALNKRRTHDSTDNIWSDSIDVVDGITPTR
jgi:hypothetical protein